MSQVTLYLDEETEAALNQAAAAAGLSKSRWVAELIRRHAGHTWPPQCRELAGAYGDFPLRDEALNSAQAADAPRVPF